jgi:hypothetical protein
MMLAITAVLLEFRHRKPTVAAVLIGFADAKFGGAAYIQ